MDNSYISKAMFLFLVSIITKIMQMYQKQTACCLTVLLQTHCVVLNLQSSYCIVEKLRGTKCSWISRFSLEPQMHFHKFQSALVQVDAILMQKPKFFCECILTRWSNRKSFVPQKFCTSYTVNSCMYTL